MPARRISRGGAWSRRLAGFALVLMAVAGLAHRFGTLDTVALVWTYGVAGVLALVAVPLAIAAFVRFWRRGDRVFSDIGWALLFAIVALAPFAWVGYRAIAYPVLNDVSTDPVAAPALRSAAQERMPGMNPVAPIAQPAAALQAQVYPSVTGRRYDVPLERVEEVVNAMVEARGWRITGVRQSVGVRTDVTLEATARTLILGFWSDVAIRLTDEEGATLVDMRSASRYGRHDLGDNAARISAFLDELDRLVVARTPVAPTT